MPRYSLARSAIGGKNICIFGGRLLYIRRREAPPAKNEVFRRTLTTYSARAAGGAAQLIWTVGRCCKAQRGPPASQGGLHVLQNLEGTTVLAGPAGRAGPPGVEVITNGNLPHLPQSLTV